MKKEDMKKLYLEGRNGSNYVKYFLLIFFFAILSGSDFAQTINGFCGFREFETSEGNKKFFIDENLLAFGSTEKSITLHHNFLSPNPSSGTTLFFPYLISDLKSFGNEQNKNSYIFTSRKERRAGWFVIEDSADLKIMDEIKFESYPGQILVDDFNRDGKPDGIISGNSFDGLSLLRKSKGKLREHKIVRNRVFSSAASIDLDYDNYPDIAAVDLFSNKLIFFYNNQSGDFYENRSLDFTDEIKNIISLDFNSDGFADILLHTNKNITLLKGDSVSSFAERKIIKTEGSISKLIASNINDDGFSDFILLDQSDDIIKLLLSGKADAYREIVMLKSRGITDLSVVEESGDRENIDGLFVLSGEGKIINLYKTEEIKGFFRISLGAVPKAVSRFGKDRKLAFVDEYNNSLKIISSSPNFLFDEINSYRLSQTFSNIYSVQISKGKTAAYLYSPGEKLIEILKFDAGMNKISETNLYANKPIREIAVGVDNEKDSIYSIVEKNKVVDKLLFAYKDFRYAAEVKDSLFINSIASKFSLTNPDTIYSWTMKGDSIYLNLFHSDSSYEKIHSMPVDDSVSVEMFSIGSKIINIIKDKSSVRGLSIENSEPEYLFVDSKSFELIKNNESFFSDVFSADEYLYAYKNKNLYKFTFEFNALKYISRIETEEMNSYFISKFFKNIGTDKKYLIYTSPGKSYITFRWID